MIGLDPDEDITGRRIGEFSPAWARERVHREALAVARRDGVWRGEGAGCTATATRSHVAGHRRAQHSRRRGRLLRDDRARHDARACRRGGAARERGALPHGVRAGADRRVADRPRGPLLQVNDAFCRTVRRTREELMRLGPAPSRTPTTSRRPPMPSRCSSAAARRCSASRSATSTRSATRSGRGQRQPVLRRTTAGRSTSSAWSRTSASGASRTRCNAACSRRSCRASTASSSPCATCPGTRQTAISGDWYDVIPLPDGRVGVVIGDVVGRGIEAAATMSQLRTALRAYAIEGLEPAEVVGKLHRLVDHLRRRPQHDARLPGPRPVHARGALRQRRAICRSSTCPPTVRRGSCRARLDAARRGAGRRARSRRSAGARARRHRPAVHRRARRAP